MSNEEIEPLVACATCGAVVGPDHAEQRWVNLQGVPEKVWICRTCMRLGRGEEAEKYIMRERKHGQPN